MRGSFRCLSIDTSAVILYSPVQFHILQRKYYYLKSSYLLICAFFADFQFFILSLSRQYENTQILNTEKKDTLYVLFYIVSSLHFGLGKKEKKYACLRIQYIFKIVIKINLNNLTFIILY